MAHAGDGIATAPIDLAIARIRAVYRNWNRDTTVSQMRSDWDAAFGGCTAPVMCEPVAAGRVDGEWISPAHAPKDKAILYFHGGGFRIGSVASHRGPDCADRACQQLPRARDQLSPCAGASFSGGSGRRACGV
jgi:epsilon-lactone hydrolase